VSLPSNCLLYDGAASSQLAGWTATPAPRPPPAPYPPPSRLRLPPEPADSAGPALKRGSRSYPPRPSPAPPTAGSRNRPLPRRPAGLGDPRSMPLPTPVHASPLLSIERRVPRHLRRGTRHPWPGSPVDWEPSEHGRRRTMFASLRLRTKSLPRPARAVMASTRPRLGRAAAGGHMPVPVRSSPRGRPAPAAGSARHRPCSSCSPPEYDQRAVGI